VLDAFDTVKEAAFKIFLPAKTNHSRSRVNSQAYEGAKNQKDFKEHQYAQKVIIRIFEVCFVILAIITVSGTFKERIGVGKYCKNFEY
jgi:hypothetical protein